MASQSWLIDGARRDEVGLLRYAHGLGFVGWRVPAAIGWLSARGIEARPVADAEAWPLAKESQHVRTA